MKTLLLRAVRYLRDTRAVSALEYAIVVGVIATVIAAAVVTLGGNLSGALATIGAEVTEAATEVDD